MGDWDTPPTAAEMDPWAKPPTPQEMGTPEQGMGSRILHWLTTPSDNYRKAVIEPNMAAREKYPSAGPFPLNSDSGDLHAGIQAFVSGIPGYQRYEETPEAQDRMSRFANQHKAASILLPLLGGFGKPAALPAAAAQDAGTGGAITSALDSVANKAGRRVLYGGANGLSERFPVPDASIEAAHKAGAFKIGGTTEHAANVLSDALDEAGALKGDVVKDMEAAGIQGPDSANVAQYLRGKADWFRKNSAGTHIPELYERAASDIEAAGDGGRLGVQQAENIKQSLQDAARYGDPNEKLLNIQRRQIASVMRQGVEDASGADAATLGTNAAQSANAELVPAKQAYALLAPAAKAAEKGLSQATKRNAFSLRDTIMAAPMAAAHGVGAGAAMGILTKAARTYGPSTTAFLAKGAANLGRGASEATGDLAAFLVSRGVPKALADSIAAAEPASQ